MRPDLWALSVATLLTLAALPAAVGLAVHCWRAWVATRGIGNGRRQVAYAALRAALVRIAKVLLQTGQVAVAAVILWRATTPVSWWVTSFVWLLAAAQALSAVDVWWQLSSRVRLVRGAADASRHRRGGLR